MLMKKKCACFAGPILSLVPEAGTPFEGQAIKSREQRSLLGRQYLQKTYVPLQLP